jgi:ubiquinone/menaquinone biosynthesis C-methylase UbiE/DNA-binding HxlR family transcriptional regulator
MQEVLEALKAAGEPTRLRILAVLDACELTVTELCRVLGQSQPRVSRHLRLLCEAGLLERHAEGTSAFYRLTRVGVGHDLYRSIDALLDHDDAVLDRDRGRLAAVRAERAEIAAEYFATIAGRWDRVRDLHVGDGEVEQALLASVGLSRIGDLVDIGTGTGRILELFADRIDHGLGIDLSREMLNVARSRLDEQGMTNCSVRHGNVYDLDVADGSMDVAVLHHVLHFLDDPAAAVEQAARTLRPNGRLLVVDFAPHTREALRSDFAHRRLGFTDDEVAAWCERFGLIDVTVSHLLHVPPTADEALTVTLWVATQRLDAPAVYSLEAAS